MPRRTFNPPNDNDASAEPSADYKSMMDSQPPVLPSSATTAAATTTSRTSKRQDRQNSGLMNDYSGYKPPAAGGSSSSIAAEDEVYIVQQDYGVLSIFFSVIQTIILGLMMWQCGMAPLNLNPMLGPYPDALSEWGGKNAPLIVEDGQWYRLLTPILLHAGLIHLGGNVAVQLEMGVFFEKEWGSARWLIVYLGSGLGSSILSVIFMPQAVSVGSSGAVMGLFGAKLAELVLRMFEDKETAQQRVAHQVRREQGFAVTCSVIVVLLFSFVPYVDWAAHLGGLLAGLAIGIIIFSLELKYCVSKTIGMAVGITLTVVGFVVALNYMYSGDIEIIEELRDVCGYYQENVEEYECNCMRDEYFANMQNGEGSQDNRLFL